MKKRKLKKDMASVRRRVGAKLRYMSPAEAWGIILKVSERDAKEGATIEHPEIRSLTGGYASQNINFYVMRKLSECARQEGASVKLLSNDPRRARYVSERPWRHKADSELKVHRFVVLLQPIYEDDRTIAFRAVKLLEESGRPPYDWADEAPDSVSYARQFLREDERFQWLD